jgi:hypothetical protein
LSVADLAEALHSLSRGLSLHASIDVGYVAAVAGIVLLAVFAVTGLAILTVRLARRIWNASPRGLLTALFISAWVLLLVGLLTP